MEDRQARQLRTKMTGIVRRSSLGAADVMRARRTTMEGTRNSIVKSSGTLRDPRSTTT